MRIWIYICLMCFSPIALSSWFQNHEQQGEQAFQQQDYGKAAELFNDAYRRGVALYKDGRYEDAAQAFEQVEREDMKAPAQYNLGNAYFQQQQYDKAMKAYQESLKLNPDNEDARHNLALAEQMKQEQQNQQNSEQDNQQSSENSENSEQQNSESDQANESQQQQSEQDSQQANQSNQEEQQENQQAQSDQTQTAENEQQPDEQASQATEQTENQEHPNDEQSIAALKQQELDNMADVWLNRLENNPQQLLRNQFYLDSRRSDLEQQERTW